MEATEALPRGNREGLPRLTRENAEIIKAAIPVEDLAEQHTELRAYGGKLSGRCPLPDHEDRSPSFYVYPDTRSWYCYGCNEGGDIFDLYSAIRGGEFWEALQGLRTDFGVDLKERPAHWFKRQTEKERLRHKLLEIRRESYRRRLFKVFYVHDLALIEDEVEREQEARLIWEALGSLVRAHVA